jgi:rod shape-determining protein MreD
VREALKATPLVFCAVVLQGSWFSALSVGRGGAGFLLVTIVSLALLRGSVFGATAGFLAGLAYDISVYQRLGLTSLLLTLAGFWTGRYGETTGRDRAHAPYLAVFVITILYELGATCVRFLLGETVSLTVVLIHTLPGEALLNLALTAPVYALCRWAVGRRGEESRSVEVKLIG